MDTLTQHIFFIGKKSFSLVLLTFIINSVQCQKTNALCNTESRNEVSASHLLCTSYQDIDPFTGKPGGMNDWGLGSIYLSNGDSIPNRYLVYNALGSNLIWKKPESTSGMLVDKSTVKGFYLQSDKTKKRVEYQYFRTENWYYTDNQGAFFEVLVNDSISLYLLNSIERFPMTNDMKLHHYYFVSKSGIDFKKVRLNRMDFCAALDHSKEFRKHLHKLHMRVNKREKLIKAMQEYNTFVRDLKSN